MAKVSIVGAGIENAPGYAAQMFGALADAGINIEMISTSEIRITCIIAEDHVDEAARAARSLPARGARAPDARPSVAARRGAGCLSRLERFTQVDLHAAGGARLAGRCPVVASRRPTSRRRPWPPGPRVDGAAGAALLVSAGFRPPGLPLPGLAPGGTWRRSRCSTLPTALLAG